MDICSLHMDIDIDVHHIWCTYHPKCKDRQNQKRQAIEIYVFSEQLGKEHQNPIVQHHFPHEKSPWLGRY